MCIGIFEDLESDHSIVERIIFTFERMVRKYSGDLNVWLKYVEYCESYNYENRLAGLYPRYFSWFSGDLQNPPIPSSSRKYLGQGSKLGNKSWWLQQCSL